MRREDPRNLSVTEEILQLSADEREYTTPHNQMEGVIHAVEQSVDCVPSTRRIRNLTFSATHSARGVELYHEFVEFVEATEQDICGGADVRRSFDHFRTAAYDTLAIYDADLYNQIEEVLTVAEQCILSGLDPHETERLFDHVLTAIHEIIMDYFADEVKDRPAA